MMDGIYCLDQKEMKKANAELFLACQLGLIEKAGLEEVEKRRRKKNEMIQKQLDSGEVVYGLSYYSSAAYLQYELTRFKLDFVQELPKIREHYFYRPISENEKREFYRQNQDLFTRYFGDRMEYEEVAMIIEKRIREAEYDELVENILCQF